MKRLHFLFCFGIVVLSPYCVFSQSWQALDKQFETLRSEKRYAEALSVAQESIDIAEKQHKVTSKEYHTSLQNLAESYMMLGQWESALQYYKELLRREISRLAEISVSMSTTIQSITGLYDLLHDKKSASSVFHKAIQRLSQLQVVDHSVYTDLSDYYTQALLAQPAPTINQSLEMIARQTGADVSSMKQIANQYDANLVAERNERQPATVDTGKDSIQGLIDTCAENKRYSHFSGGVKSCTSLYELRKQRGLENSIEHARTCFDLGYFYMLSSKHSSALDYYLEGVELWEKNKFPKNEQYIEALYNASGSLQIGQEYKLAKTLLLKAEKAVISLKDKQNSLYPGILAMLAAMQRLDGDYTSAEKSYDRYRDYYLARKNYDPAVWLSYYLGVGIVYERLGKWQEADRVYLLYNKATTDLISDLSQNITLSSEKKVAQNFVGFRYNQDFFYSYSIKRKDQNPEFLSQMYNSELLTKGLVLRTFKRKADAILQSGDQALIDDFEQWIEARQKEAKLSLLSVSDRKVSLDDLEWKIKQLEDRILLWFMENQHIGSPGFHWRDVQKKLLVEDAAIEFVKFQNFDLAGQEWSDKVLYGALVLRPDYDHPRFVSLFEEAEFREFLDDTHDPIPFEQVRKMYTWLPGQYGGIYRGDSLYTLVWQALEPYLEGVSKIYYSPAGLLHNISFGAVPVDEKKSLTNKYNLQLLSTTGLLADNRADFYFTQEDQTLLFGGILYDLEPEQQKVDDDKQGRKGSELFIRDHSFDWTRSKAAGGAWQYLAGSLDEVQGISGILDMKKRRHQTVTRENAREEHFKEVSKMPSEIIHIATHGFFFPTDRAKKQKRLQNLQGTTQIDPDGTLKRSGLLFAGANTTWLGKHLPDGLEDGILSSYEISKLNLTRTKLVVLSACETGLGELGGGEGVYGLQRAFKLAGVDNIIMSLWQIPDAQTAELMDMFYSEWLDGQEIQEAFHSARQRMSEKYEPYFWGAFVLLQ